MMSALKILRLVRSAKVEVLERRDAMNTDS